MLSYRHSYHAGNFADVLKHVVLIEILEYLLKKDKPLHYVDTHAGAGVYDLSGAKAQKLQEYRAGVGLLNVETFPELARYFEIIAAHNPPGRLERYPGSPLIASRLLRRGDRAWLFELHPEDARILEENFQWDRRVRVAQQDGYAALPGLLPPVSRRALTLIDPSYEIKSDYQQVVRAVADAVAKFATGTYVIWYPVVERERVLQMQRELVATGIPDIQRFELCVLPDSSTPGMTGAGMLVINPPWTLLTTMSQLLPRLTAALGQHPDAFCTAEILVAQ
jgi:23S rRNA (adenine2030-N6)-methyltransferase